VSKVTLDVRPWRTHAFENFEKFSATEISVLKKIQKSTKKFK
jgi:hypothetical protein